MGRMEMQQDKKIWKCRGLELSLERPLVMGILNVTPDSFSDGGSHMTADKAVEAALEMIDDGADIIDIGGESTRPGADYVGEEEEIRRVVPVVEALAASAGVPLSIDTRKAAVARLALEAGAQIINDVSALRDDPDMLAVVRDSGAGSVLMHMAGTPKTMQRHPAYKDVVREVRGWLKRRVASVVAAGVDPATIAIDPGIGFGKTTEQNLQLLAGLPRFATLGAPVLVGLSRKNFIGEITEESDPGRRLSGSLTGMVWSLWHGASILRVHDVKASRQAVDLACAIARA